MGSSVKSPSNYISGRPSAAAIFGFPRTTGGLEEPGRLDEIVVGFFIVDAAVDGLVEPPLTVVVFPMSFFAAVKSTIVAPVTFKTGNLTLEVVLFFALF